MINTTQAEFCLPSAKGHKQIIARFTHAQKRSELLKATKNIPNNSNTKI
jgi:hypothetical protein